MDISWKYLIEQVLDPHKVEVLVLPLLASLVVIAIHAYLGIHVIARKVIFVDIALAQIAAVGATVAILRGWEPGSPHTFVYSMGFATLAAAVFAFTRTKEERVPQEAVIGLTYAIASAAAILLSALSPHGAEHLTQLVAGNVLFASRVQVGHAAIVYGAVGLFHVAFGKRFLLISERPEEAYSQGIRIRLWDFLFYLSFAVVITLSVQIVGVLLVFCYLVAPAVFGALFARGFWARLWLGWVISIIVTATGLYAGFDYPSSPAVMCVFGAALVLGGVVRAIAGAKDRVGAAALALAIAGGITGLTWSVWRFDRVPEDAHGHEDDPAHMHPPGEERREVAHEHPVGTSLSALRAALRDPDDGVREHAAEELGKLGDPAAVKDLLALLKDRKEGVREQAADALGLLGSAQAIPALVEAVRGQDDEWVRMRMARALVRLGSRDGIPVLLDLAKDGEARKVREEALQALLLAAGRDDKQVLRELSDWWKQNQDGMVWDAGKKAFVPKK